MSTWDYLLRKHRRTGRFFLGLTGVFVLFSAMPAPGQAVETIRNGWSSGPMFVPLSLLLICLSAQVLIAAGLGVYFLRHYFKSKPSGIFPKIIIGRNGPRGPINPSPIRRAA